MKVKFVPQEVEFEIKQGQSVMDLAHEKGIPIRSTCNGLPSCAECRIRVIDGDWNTNPPSRKELGLIGTGYYIDQRRLSCQLLCFGDITVDTAEQVEKSAEGPVTKKFLTKVHKTSASESHSIGGVCSSRMKSFCKRSRMQRPSLVNAVKAASAAAAIVTVIVTAIAEEAVAVAAKVVSSKRNPAVKAVANPVLKARAAGAEEGAEAVAVEEAAVAVLRAADVHKARLFTRLFPRSISRALVLNPFPFVNPRSMFPSHEGSMEGTSSTIHPHSAHRRRRFDPSRFHVGVHLQRYFQAAQISGG
jgi:ferredoxin, 2Fe-2S